MALPVTYKGSTISSTEEACAFGQRSRMAPEATMGILQIATVGEDLDPIMVGVREYPVSRLILIHTPEFEEQARRARALLQPLKLDTQLIEVQGDIMMGVLRAVGGLVAEGTLKFDDVYINVASGTRMTGCAATAAAFVNGVKAFGVMEGKPFMLPVLRFSYQELVSDAKLQILRAIEGLGETVESLQHLSDVAGIEKSLLSYHLRGGKESKGLEDLGLVEIDRGDRGRLGIRLTPMGKMLLGGYAKGDPTELPHAPART